MSNEGGFFSDKSFGIEVQKWAKQYFKDLKTLPKCYIAGKIGGLSENQYKAVFEQAEAEVIALGYQPINPVKLPHLHARKWSDYMREDIRALTGCQFLYAIHNWRQSPGATIEVRLATELGITVIHQENKK